MLISVCGNRHFRHYSYEFKLSSLEDSLAISINILNAHPYFFAQLYTDRNL